MTDLHRLMAGLADRMPAGATPVENAVENAVAAARRIRRRRTAAVTALSALVVVGFLVLTYFAAADRAEPQPTQPRPSSVPTSDSQWGSQGRSNPTFRRHTPDPAALARARELLPTVRSVLDQARTQATPVTADALRRALATAGVPVDLEIGLAQEDSVIAVGIDVPPDACLFGYVWDGGVDLAADGRSVDSGCFPDGKAE